MSMELSGYKYKTRAYVLDCEAHIERNRKINELQPNINIQKALEKLGVELILHMKYKQMLKELATEEFLGYSTLMFIIDFECFCDLDLLLSVICEHINSNERLRCITKIVLTYSYIKLNVTVTHLTVTCMRDGKSARFRLPTEAQMRARYPELEESAFEMLRQTPVFILIKLFSENAKARKVFVERVRQLSDLKAPMVDNLILIQCKKLGLSREKTIFLSILERLFEFAMKQSVQEMINGVIHDCEDTAIYEEVANFSATTADGCFFFNVNPALAIVINHLTFQNHQFRKGSEKDIECISKVCTLKKIPHIVIRDGSAEEVQRLMQMVQTTDLSLLKYVFVFVMSHGDEGDIIYTKSDIYTVDKHIREPLTKNKSLENAKKLLLINACRGTFDPRYDEDDQPTENTDIENLDSSTSILYSARKGCVSLRSADGSICVQKFCEAFEKCFQQYSLKKLHENIENELLDELIDFDSVTEYCHNPAEDPVLKMEFDNFTDFLQLYKKLEDFVEN